MPWKSEKSFEILNSCQISETKYWLTLRWVSEAILSLADLKYHSAEIQGPFFPAKKSFKRFKTSRSLIFNHSPCTRKTFLPV